MKITILCVGKIKEAYWEMAIKEYAKRLSRYCKLDIVEVADEKTPDGAGELIEEKIKQIEAERLFDKMPENAYKIALTIEGVPLDSVALSKKINTIGVNGKSHIVFIIGGSLGLSSQIIAKVDYQLSFSKMTFPHQMVRCILLEQIYRSYRILNHEPYHK